jgi:two-component system, NarL family, nitrate/nitrite response regulator NarL
VTGFPKGSPSPRENHHCLYLGTKLHTCTGGMSMRNNVAQTQTGLACPGIPYPTIEGLVRVLVEHTAKSKGFTSDREPKHDGEEIIEEIIIDTEVDGARYLLVRLPKPTHRYVSLSPREQEIVRMVARGHPNKVIADVLNISSWTVWGHLRRIFAKLGVGSRAAMVARVLEEGRAWDQFQASEKPVPRVAGASTTPSATCDARPSSNSGEQPTRPGLTIPGKNFEVRGGIASRAVNPRTR